MLDQRVFAGFKIFVGVNQLVLILHYPMYIFLAHYLRWNSGEWFLLCRSRQKSLSNDLQPHLRFTSIFLTAEVCTNMFHSQVRITRLLSKLLYRQTELNCLFIKYPTIPEVPFFTTMRVRVWPVWQPWNYGFLQKDDTMMSLRVHVAEFQEETILPNTSTEHVFSFSCQYFHNQF